MCSRGPIHIPGNCPAPSLSEIIERAQENFDAAMLYGKRVTRAREEGYALERVGIDHRGLPRYRLHVLKDGGSGNVPSL